MFPHYHNAFVENHGLPFHIIPSLQKEHTLLHCKDVGESLRWSGSDKRCLCLSTANTLHDLHPSIRWWADLFVEVTIQL